MGVTGVEGAEEAGEVEATRFFRVNAFPFPIDPSPSFSPPPPSPPRHQVAKPRKNPFFLTDEEDDDDDLLFGRFRLFGGREDGGAPGG